ncbi:M15 family metallopeptidase [Cellulomonas soli]|uniref:M15 family metallopeptidase n=1 Tax=Cellulomonas soli TaxID=931535 RepID=UPI0031F02D10
MSDRLPISRRRSAGGKHVAQAARLHDASVHTPAHHAVGRTRTRLAQGGLVTTLAVALVGVVVAPVWGQASGPGVATTGASTSSAVSAPLDVEAAQADSAIFVASRAVDDAREAQAAATQVAADPTQVAALEAATAELDALLAAAQTTDPLLASRTDSTASRSTERTSLAAATPEATEPAADTAGAATDPSAATDSAATDPPATDRDADGETADDAASADTAATAGTTDEVSDALLPGAASLTTGVDRLRAAVAAVAALTDQVQQTTEKTVADQQAAAVAAAAAAQAAADQAAQRAAWKASLLGYANGRIPASALCSPAFDAGIQLRCDAAEALDELDAAYVAQFGVHLTVSDSYRSYAGQVACVAAKGSLCAKPGTSNHGTGVAVDLGGGVEGFGTAQFVWMTQNAAAYSWVHPDWAAASGSKPEAWHWEYVG